ncbi:CoA-binding protein [Cognatitamlana onchidii]|uniref:CoA-binding protein n=1 Tax=Cognatitamlana onchidii TaxID=2562860 RepID=UPI0010A5DD89|nr:CoA-binding protein [Algibacter onchidii]
MKKKTLVFGLSLKPNRYSNYAPQRLVAKGIDVVAFGLKKGEVSGVVIDTDLLPYKGIHTITLYINANRQRDYYDYIVSLNPHRVIFNPGTENPVFYQILEKNNIFYEEACTLVLLSTNQY